MSITIQLPRPHPGQERIRSEARRFNVANCGRRFGKSVVGTTAICEAAIDGRPAAYFEPTYKMLTEAWRHVRDTLRPVTREVSEQERTLRLITGGSVEFWSLDNIDSCRGRKYGRVVIDEAAMVRDLQEAWEAVIRPTLTDLRGDAWFLSTPKGRNYFWELHSRGGDTDHPDYAAWTMPTTANPFIDPAEVEAARLELPERVFRQEFLAEFIEDAGGVFRGVHDVIDTGRSENEQAQPGAFYSVGIDLARLEDFTVLSVLDSSGRQVYHERFNRISWERQIAAIVRVVKAFNARVVIDSTGVGDPVTETLRKACWEAGASVDIEEFRFSSVTKEQVINRLAIDIEQRAVRLMDIPTQTHELLAYEYELTTGGNVRMNAPAGQHDDCVISLALANWGRSKLGGISFFDPARVIIDCDEEAAWRSVSSRY